MPADCGFTYFQRPERNVGSQRLSGHLSASPADANVTFGSQNAPFLTLFYFAL